MQELVATFQSAAVALQSAQFLGQPGSCLGVLFDVEAAVSRGAAAGKVRPAPNTQALCCFQSWRRAGADIS